MKTFISFIIVICSVAVVYALYSNKPITKRTTPSKPVPVVKAVQLKKSSEKIFIEAFGSVIPARKVSLRPEVEGRVVGLHPDVVPGGVVDKGDMLVEIDSIDYELQASQLEAEVVRAEYELELEKGQQVIAREEWRLLEGDITASERGKALALRQPHLRQALMRLEAAKSKLAAARLNVERAKLYAPFHGLILEESVEVGQLLSKQTSILTLVDIDTFWVQVSIPFSRLSHIKLSTEAETSASEVDIIWDQGGGGTIRRRGIVFKLLGALEEKGKMARLLVKLPDPFNLSGKHSGKILLGSFVKVQISAGVLDDIYVIPREALRDGSLWFVNGNSTLEQVDFSVLWRREGELLISADIRPDLQLVVSRLLSPLPGLRVSMPGAIGGQDTVIEQAR